jgi:Type I restriction enzyme R protein N terminus (HSDR_N)
MTQTIPIEKNIKTLNQLQDKFNLKRSQSDRFFTEWNEDFHEITEDDRLALDRIKQKYWYQLSDGHLGEETIKMVVLSPLFDLAGFYDPPFRFKTEVTVQISVEERDELLRGRIDALAIQNQLWVVAIESKQTSFSLELALPQALTYMLCHPSPDRPSFGLITNGGNFMFVKLIQQEFPEYDVSDIFSLLPRRNQLYDVLQILRKLGSLLTTNNE